MFAEDHYTNQSEHPKVCTCYLPTLWATCMCPLPPVKATTHQQ